LTYHGSGFIIREEGNTGTGIRSAFDIAQDDTDAMAAILGGAGAEQVLCPGDDAIEEDVI